MKLPDLKNKTILITQNSLLHISGSEVVTLELAKFFKEKGANITVFTWCANESIVAEFTKADINVTTDDYDEKILNPDIVWVHHQVLPIGLINNIRSKACTPNCYFYHMSAYDDLYIEHPYIHNLEKELASNSLFVSEECMQFNLKKYGKTAFTKPLLFPNFFPIEYAEASQQRRKLNNILIVSNHPPEEIKSASTLLQRQGYKVSSLGCNGTSYQIISPKILEKTDAVITIGKTVQYCLAMNIPVYVYDHFGGCGYLTNKNYAKAKYANFSGRGFKKKNPGQIAKELAESFDKGKQFQTKNYNTFLKEFALSDNLSNILSFKPRIIRANTHYWNYVIAAESITKLYITDEQRIVNQNSTIDYYHNIITSKEEEIKEKTKAIALKEQHIQNLQNSHAVRLAQSIRNLSQKIKKNTFNLSRPEITAVLCVYNEEQNIDGCLNHIEPYVDKIIVLDDASTDQTIKIVRRHSKVTKILRNKNKTEWLERENRKRIITEAYKLSKNNNSWVLCVDADERFELSFLRNLRTIATQYQNHPVTINVHFRELWDSIYQYRNDGIWNEKRKSVFFPLSNQMTFNYTNEHHIPWHYQELADKEQYTDYNLYHLKMVKPIDRQKRAELYNRLDPNKKMQAIGYDYLTDTTNLTLATISKEHDYDTNTVPSYYQND